MLECLLNFEELSMCDVCKKNKIDYRFLNGKKSALSPAQFYQVQVGKTSVLRLCYLHDIELFRVGERRFLSQHRSVIPLLKSRLT